MKKEEGLKADRSRGDKYLALLNSVGWKQLEEDLKEDWLDALRNLIKEESVMSRVKLQVIQDIFDKVGTNINFGEVAKERLLKWNHGKR